MTIKVIGTIHTIIQQLLLHRFVTKLPQIANKQPSLFRFIYWQLSNFRAMFKQQFHLIKTYSLHWKLSKKNDEALIWLLFLRFSTNKMYLQSLFSYFQFVRPQNTSPASLQCLGVRRKRLMMVTEFNLENLHYPLRSVFLYFFLQSLKSSLYHNKLKDKIKIFL